MTPELSRRLGAALGKARHVTPAERATIIAAVATAETWAELPPNVQRLVLDLEQRR